MTSAAAEAPVPRPGRRVLELAALGVAAVPGIDPVLVVGTRPTRDGVDTAVVRDRDSRDWVVAAPTVGAAGAELEAEIAVLRLLASRMPFATPDPRGLAAMRGGGRALVYQALRGAPVLLPSMSADPSLADSVGRSIAAIHALDPDQFIAVGVGVYDSQSLRQRCLATLDRGAEPGIVPAGLLSRWEASIENVSMWRFEPRPVHGELVSDRVLVEKGAVSGILDWAGARVSDPAEDLAWIAVGADAAGLDRVLRAYRAVRPQVDTHLVERAVLHGEMALVSWLMHGLRLRDQRIVADATSMLQELATWHDEHPATGGASTAATAGRTVRPSPTADPGPAAGPGPGPTVDPNPTADADPTADPGPTGDPHPAVDADPAVDAHPAVDRDPPVDLDPAVEPRPTGTASPPADERPTQKTNGERPAAGHESGRRSDPTPPPTVIDSSTNTVPQRSAMGVSSVPRYSAARYAEADADDTDVIDLAQVRAYLAARSGDTAAPATTSVAEPAGVGGSSVTLPNTEPSLTS